MTTEALKATAVTNLSATPPVRTTNYGMPTQVMYGSLTATTGKTAGSVYSLIRLPSKAVLHSLKLWLDSGVTTLDGDITLYYGGGPLDGTLVTAHVFATAIDLHAITSATEYLLGNNIKGTNLGKRLWEMAALASDPGGMFDIVVVSTSTNSGAPVINCQAVVGRN